MKFAKKIKKITMIKMSTVIAKETREFLYFCGAQFGAL